MPSTTEAEVPGLVVVSNRGPWRCSTGNWSRSSGGLVTALDPVLRERGGCWICGAEPRVPEAPPAPELDYDHVEVSLGDEIRAHFYDGFANAVLWPVLHGFPTLGELADAPWSAYEHANREFAHAAIEHSREASQIWVHDYHLMRAPELIRKARPDAPIGWFCHVPWPGVDVFAVLPWRRALLEGLLGADVIGFHSTRYAHHFLDCAERLAGAVVDREQMAIHGKYGRTRVITAPIGIPTAEVHQRASSDEVRRREEAVRAAVDGRRILLGVDRLDYTKGIPDRLRAFVRLLERHPHLLDELVLVQLVVPSREDVSAYADLKERLEQMVGHINGEFGTTGIVAVHYLYRGLEPADLYAHYRAADVALVTPLRDGMNLVAMEYVASRTEEDGALVLSEFAGAAERLTCAYLVNPYDVDEVADQIERALNDRPSERTRRMRALREVVAELDVHHWAQAFLGQLHRQGPGDGESVSSELDPELSAGAGAPASGPGLVAARLPAAPDPAMPPPARPNPSGPGAAARR